MGWRQFLPFEGEGIGLDWIGFSIAGLVLAGIKGFWLKRTADTVPHHLHVGLISMIVTMLLGVCLFLVRDLFVSSELSLPAIGVVGLGGIAYALTTVLGASAQ